MVRVEVDGQYRGLFRELEDNVQVELLGSSSWSSKQRLEEDGSWYEEGDRGTGPKSRWWRDMMLVKLTAWRSKVHFNSSGFKTNDNNNNNSLSSLASFIFWKAVFSFSEYPSEDKSNWGRPAYCLVSFLYLLYCIKSSSLPLFFLFLKENIKYVTILLMISPPLLFSFPF